MKRKLFDKLLESVREGGAILRGERGAARTSFFEEPEVQRLRRARLAKEFAKLKGPAEQAAAEEIFVGEAEWPEY